MSTPNQEELVERVVEVTGATSAEAQHFLAACSNDVEAAVILYFEHGLGGGTSTSAAANAEPAIVVDDDEDEVRAPIAPKREQLIGPEDDNFYSPAPTRLARVPQRVKICPLRDFAREGAIMEEQLQMADTAAASLPTDIDNHANDMISRSRRRMRAADLVSTARSMHSTRVARGLGDLFRPPTDIVFGGKFQAACARAKILKQWLLVNVQSDNFDSQLLNRDVWSNKQLRTLILPAFLLWQVNADSGEGRRFVAFYHCAKLPYVCVIDPRTGEEIWRAAEPKQATLQNELQNFLREHNDFSKELEAQEPSTSKRSLEKNCNNVDENEASTSNHADKRAKLLELSEDEQIAMAIRNSMLENGVKSQTTTAIDASDESEDDNSDDEADSKSNCISKSFEEQLGVAKELTMLKLRLLNAEKIDEVVQLRWPSDTRLRVLRLYIAQHHSHIPQQGYKLICAFPRKTLEMKHDASSLKEMGLHPSANLHVTLDD